MDQPTVSVITPVYNERRNLEENINRIEGSLRGAGISFEVVIVDDNSPDGSGALADEIARRKDFVKVLHRAGKKGLGTAYKDAFPLTRGRFIVSMDSDLSHDPSFIPVMLKRAEERDIVIGSRLINGGKIVGRNPLRDLLSIFANLAIRATTGTAIRDWTSGLRIYHRGVWEEIMPRVNCNKWDFQFESLYKAIESGFTVGEIPITFYERADGESKFNPQEALDFIYSFLKVRFGK
ncbi:MAG: polyprenol monophosphomannose synthase [Candidatus Bathyarchaeota archaeon]|nr:polyprenol monophosphomannose synthase [Candidatus Bathyarchaeota archaeon]